MPFWPDSPWGIAFVGALVLCSLTAWRGKHFDMRTVAAVWAIWFLTRTVCWVDFENYRLWLGVDLLAIVFFVAVRTRVALVCAALYLFPYSFDLWALVYGVSFDAGAAVFEAVGYLAMLLIAGAAHHDTERPLRTVALSGARGSGNNNSLARRLAFWRLTRTGG